MCALCEDPVKCNYPDKYSGYEGAIRCLVENGGDVAFTKVIFVRRFFGVSVKKKFFYLFSVEKNSFCYFLLNKNSYRSTIRYQRLNHKQIRTIMNICVKMAHAKQSLKRHVHGLNVRGKDL